MNEATYRGWVIQLPTPGTTRACATATDGGARLASATCTGRQAVARAIAEAKAQVGADALTAAMAKG